MKIIMLLAAMGALYYLAHPAVFWVEKQAAPAVCDANAETCGVLKAHSWTEALKDLAATRASLEAGLRVIALEQARLGTLRRANIALQKELKAKTAAALTEGFAAPVELAGAMYANREDVVQQASLLQQELQTFDERLQELDGQRQKTQVLLNESIIAATRLRSTLNSLEAVTAIDGATRNSDIVALIEMGDSDAQTASRLASSVVRSTAELSSVPMGSVPKKLDLQNWIKSR